jgi:hypothetical protein
VHFKSVLAAGWQMQGLDVGKFGAKHFEAALLF